MKNKHIALAVAAAMGLSNFVEPVKSLKNNLKKPMNNARRHNKPHQGAKECQRRIRQGNAGSCYVHGAQYPG